MKEQFIKILSEQQLLTELGNPVLYINTYIRKTPFVAPNSGEHGCILTVVLELLQVVALQREAELKVLAPTWTTSFVTVVPQSRLRSTLMGLVNQQLEEFLSLLAESAHNDIEK